MTTRRWGTFYSLHQKSTQPIYTKINTQQKRADRVVPAGHYERKKQNVQQFIFIVI